MKVRFVAARGAGLEERTHRIDQLILRGSELKLEERVKGAVCPARLFAETGPFRRCEVIPTRHGNVQSDNQRRSVIFFDATPAYALGLVR